MCEHVVQKLLYYNIKKIFCVKDAKKVIKEVVKHCERCILNKRNYSTNKIKIKITARDVFKKICVDIYGPFKLENYKGSFDKKRGFFLVIVDVYSRYTRLYFNTEFSGKNVTAALKKWCEEVGMTDSIISDNGKQFKSKEVL